MKILHVAAVALATAATAAADAPRPPTPPPPPTDAPRPPPSCQVTGDVVFEIDHKVRSGKGPTSTAKVYANGAWTYDLTKDDGSPNGSATGCLANATLTEITDALKAAPWKVMIARVHCMAMSMEFTEYAVKGKRVFTSALCSGETLDAKSAAALQKIEKIVSALAPQTPPCCKK